MNQQESEVLDGRRRRTNDILKMGRMVKETIATDGWVKVGFPLLQKMIHDSTGFYKDGVWHSGNANKDYSQALMDFSNRFYAYVKNIKIASETLKEMERYEKEQWTVPMLTEGGTY